MQTILTTAGMPPRDAFAYWHDVACAKLIRLEADPLDPDDFYAEMKAGTLADVALLAYKTGKATGRSSLGEDLLLILPSTGVALTFGERQFEANRGNLVLLDTRERHLWCTLEPLVQIGLQIPRAALALRIAIGEEAVNRPLPIQGDTAQLADFLRTLVKNGPSTLSPKIRLKEREHALDLVAATVGNITGATPELDSPRQLALRKVRAVIENQLTNPATDRKSIAAAVGFSERHVNRLLALEGTSATELLRRRRLAKCREVIEQSNRQISDIAREFSWINANSFARDFKREFDLTPIEARRLVHSK
jgi:AraC-like DNA-binding protein